MDGAPSALSRLIPMPETSCLPANETECLSPSQSGMTCEPSMERPGAATLTLSAVDSPARTYRQQEMAQGSTENGADSGRKWLGSFARWDRDTSSWKTPQCSLIEGLDEFSETWPSWGTMRNGACWGRTMPDFPTGESESGSWPTPKARDWRSGGTNPDGVMARIERRRNQGVVDLPDAACLRLWRPGLTGLLNPSFSETLMGWPIGWTDSVPLGMDRFRQWLHSHGKH